ncbi:MAG TPA: CbiQ family ECF transporter T component [Accumulibacter sp.]|uniref:CbiQ family ECF transporter T component n=1 Tax=Accumulibacter sp. TaxID=2053492 RepID=UPI002BAEB6DE|nr:CbiQ family ECF transporter T component [Accumulibacter sp.]HRD90298.1 CbiQ family ECF transporter T component [Accumulibacter sp.]
MHPSTLLVAWLFVVVAIQLLAAEMLLAALLLLPLCGTVALRRWLQFVWRARWLLVSLTLILAWGTAGDAVWDFPLSPSRQGLRDAGKHAGRLVLLLMAVVVLRQQLSLPELLSGSYRLLAPLRRCGVDVDRALVRLLLVLDTLDRLPRPADWRALLAAPASGQPRVLELSDRSLSRRDHLLMALLLISLVALVALAAA